MNNSISKLSKSLKGGVIFYLAAILVVSGFFVFDIAQALVSTINVTAPNGGEQWRGIQTITWDATTIEGDGNTVSILLSSNSGASYSELITSIDATLGQYNWDTTVGPLGPTVDGSTYRIKVLSPASGIEDSSNGDFVIDNTAPVTTATVDPVSPDGENGWYIAAPSITLSCADVLSGCSAKYYRWGDSGDYSVYSTPLTVPEGDNTLYFYSEDNAVDNTGTHNKETPQTLNIKLDTIFPYVTGYTLDGDTSDVYFNPNSDSVNVSINTDEAVKFNRIYVCSSGDVVCEDGTAPKWFTQIDSYSTNALKTWDGHDNGGVIVTDGNYKLKVKIKDVAGNEMIRTLTDVIDIYMYVDTLPPSAIESTPVTPSVTSDNTPDVGITVEDGADWQIKNGATVLASGSGNNAEQTVTLPTLADDIYDLDLIATDAAGNTTEVDLTQFQVDTTNPTVSVTSPTTVTRTDPADLIASVTDASLITCTYQIDGGAAMLIACTGGSITVTDGKHTFTVNATDEAGNSGSGSITAVIDLDSNLSVGPDKDFLTIQEAIDNALTGDTITIDAGSYSEAVTINGKNLTLTGSGGAVTANSFTLTSTSVSGSTNVTAPTVNVNSGSKIQDGVLLASSGGMVTVAAGTYDEQVMINKALTLQGAGDTTIVKPSSAAKLTQVFTGLFWYGGTKNIVGIIVANVSAGSSVIVKNLKVDESSVTTKPAGADYLTGIFYRETGGTVDTVSIVGGGAWSGGDRAYGMYLSAVANTVTVEVKGSNISNFDKNGIEAMGSTLTVNIHHNTITGRGSITDEVQNGVDIGRDAVGMVNYNTISNLIYTSEQLWAAGIMFYSYVSPTGKSATANNNTITDCQIGVIFKNTNATAQNNTVNGGTVGLIGIYAEPNASGAWTASFVNNTVSGAKDDSYYHEENAAIGANTYESVSPGATLIVTIDHNILTSGSATADGISIGVGGAHGSIVATITNNTISNWQYGIRLAGALVNATISNANSNKIVGNETYGVYNGGTGTLDAEEDWWGDLTGPTHSSNPGGSGDAVNNNVDYSPWCTDEDCNEFGSNDPLAQFLLDAIPSSTIVSNPIILTITAQDSAGITRVNDNSTQVSLIADRGAAFGSNLLTMANGVTSTGVTNTVTGLVNILASQIGGSITATKQITFTQSDVTSPTIISHTPADNATSVSVLITPYIVFSEPLKSTTINSANIQLKKYSDNSNVAAMVSLVEGGTRVNITSDIQLAYNTQYYFAVSTGVQDETGNPLASALDASTKDSHEFTTATIQPIVVDEVLAQNNYVVADNTYINGWHYIFRITVNTSETGMYVKFADWVNSASSSQKVLVNGNTRLLFNIAGGGIGAGVGLTNDDIEDGYGTVQSYALGNDYDDQTLGGVPSAVNISGVDNSTAAGRQVQFDVFTKIATTTAPGFYTTTYGIKVE